MQNLLFNFQLHIRQWQVCICMRGHLHRCRRIRMLFFLLQIRVPPLPLVARFTRPAAHRLRRAARPHYGCAVTGSYCVTKCCSLPTRRHATVALLAAVVRSSERAAAAAADAAAGRGGSLMPTTHGIILLEYWLKFWKQLRASLHRRRHNAPMTFIARSGRSLAQLRKSVRSLKNTTRKQH